MWRCSAPSRFPPAGWMLSAARAATPPISASGAGRRRSVTEMRGITGDWQGRFCQFVSKTLCYCEVFIFSSLSVCAGARYLKTTQPSEAAGKLTGEDYNRIYNIFV